MLMTIKPHMIQTVQNIFVAAPFADVNTQKEMHHQ
jgi:hypothetical protein